MKILLVEDDKNSAELLYQILTSEQYHVDLAINGEIGWELVEAFEYDLILVNWVLPQLDGISFCQRLRAQNPTGSALNQATPIILLTTRDSSKNKVLGLNAGADDYIVKPIDFDELLARMRALLRRNTPRRSPVLEWGNLQVNLENCTVTCNGIQLALSPKEYAILHLLMRNPQRIFSQTALINQIWTLDEIPTESTVRTHIKSLRQKLKTAGTGNIIRTVYGLGYQLKQQQAESEHHDLVTAQQRNLTGTSSILHQNSQHLALQPPSLLIEEEFSGSETSSSSIPLLIIDSDLVLLSQLMTEASHWGVRAESVSSLVQARERLQVQPIPRVILLELNISGFVEDGWQFLATLHTHQPSIATVILTAQDELVDRVRAIRLGSRSFLKKPMAPAQVIAVVNQALKQPTPVKNKILIAGNDSQLSPFLHAVLTAEHFELTVSQDASQFWTVLKQTTPDLLILDSDSPPFLDAGVATLTETNPLSSFDLCRVIRNDPSWCNIPVLVLATDTGPETIQQAFTAGATDYIKKPLVKTELIARVQSCLERYQQLRKLTTMDELTGVSTRQWFTWDMIRLLQFAERQHQPLCFVLLNLNDMKQINAQYGYDIGDQILNYTGQLLQQSFRAEDVIGRWGDTTFAIGLFGMSKVQARKRLTEVLQLLLTQQFVVQQDSIGQATFSAGIAQYPEDGETLQMLYGVANNDLKGFAEDRSAISPVD